jgi:fluoride exporter
MSAATWVAAALLGGAGALLRFRLDAFIQLGTQSELPLGTLAVNLAGCFVLGLLTGLSITGEALLLAGTALLGSFTTFSTWLLETERLGEDGEAGFAALNVVLSLGGGIALTAAGWVLGATL